jgi:hypothetical protein
VVANLPTPSMMVMMPIERRHQNKMVAMEAWPTTKAWEETKR